MIIASTDMCNNHTDNYSSIDKMSIPHIASTESMNPTSLSSENSDNIVMLLNTLYTPGFPVHTPNLPLLSG